ncbi:MAG: C39 family peptidase [Chloroflexota bacterium]
MLRCLVSGSVIVFLALLVARPSAAQAAGMTPGAVPGMAADARLQITVPYVSQLTPVTGLGGHVAAYACGPASAAMIVAYWTGTTPPLGRAEYLMGGASLVGAGSAPWQVAQAIRTLAPGVGADAANAAGPAAAASLLSDQLALGRPVIALVRPTWFFTPINHFVVVTGFDPLRALVRFDDPMAGSEVQASLADFLAARASPRERRPYTYAWSAGTSAGAAWRTAATTSVPVAAAVVAAAAALPDSSPALGEQVTVVPAGLRLHAAPGVDSAVVSYLAQGDGACVTARQDGWVHLVIDGQEVGWANGAFVAAN